MSSLTPTSYVVLGFLRSHGPGTSYDLKQAVARGTGNFWSFPHSQLYAEPERLAAAGYLDVKAESGGRRRKVYELTRSGRDALEQWLAEGVTELPQLRDVGLLKLFFGADPKTVAPGQARAHRERLAAYEALLEQIGDDPELRGPALTLEAGIAHGRVWVEFWERLAGG